MKGGDRKNGGERVGALGAQVAILIESVRDMRAESVTGRVELKGDIAALRTETIVRMDRHEVLDDAHHAQAIARVERLEAQSLGADRAMLERVEAVEKKAAAVEAVSAYKRWLFAAVGIGGLSLVFNAAKFVAPYFGK